MHVNDSGLGLIKRFEGLRLDSYLCPAKIPTVGYGHTGPDVYIPMTITPGMAERLLLEDLERFETGVSRMIEGAKTSDNQFSAMVCLAYNIGLGAFSGSTVLKRHKLSNYRGAADAFLLWVRGGGRVLPGLQKRREAERALYLGERG